MITILNLATSTISFVSLISCLDLFVWPSCIYMHAQMKSINYVKWVSIPKINQTPNHPYNIKLKMNKKITILIPFETSFWFIYWNEIFHYLRIVLELPLKFWIPIKLYVCVLQNLYQNSASHNIIAYQIIKNLISTFLVWSLHNSTKLYYHPKV